MGLPERLSRRSFLAGCGVALVGGEASAGAAPEALAPLIGSALEPATSWAAGVGARLGACFLDVATGAELGGVSAGVAENPASNEKLVTAGTLLHHLGGAHTFGTAVYGRLSDGRLSGLVLRGEGDPSLTSADLAVTAGALSERGAREVDGIAVDQSVFDDVFVPPGFEQQPNEWAAFRAPVSAVAVDRNSVLVLIEPMKSGEPARVTFEPDGFVETDGLVRTGPRGKPSRVSAGLAGKGDHLIAHLGGAVAEGTSPLRYRQRVDDPRVLPAYALRNALTTAGVSVSGRLGLGQSAETVPLLFHRSRSLAELLPELGKNSDNFYAETLLKALAAAVHGAPGTSAAGAELAMAWLHAIGAADAGTRVTNGSGLFDTNRLSPRTLARVLVSGWREPGLGFDYVNQLAVGGVDGTLKQRFASLAARRAVLAKTGTLNDTVALSGYVLGPGQRRVVAFSFIASGVHGRLAAARQHIDAVVERVAGALWASGATNP
ncbi:MAG TPA: D-alanyl-D-alanine carboxypeptidase/D-alanyl-D-alanine-endopeptidase [Polyangiaceae bacterium]|nr:D-alanyl-D-alanine carboxypeptidase/D-alanyl-D-alanine-endopeptidase [Polyangiaceae bacterium]